MEVHRSSRPADQRRDGRRTVGWRDGDGEPQAVADATWWQLTPSEVDGIQFPVTVVGEQSTAPLTLTNRGATPRTPRIEIDGTRLTSTDCEGTLAPGASCTITATFAPVLPGAHDVFGGVTIDGVGIPYPLRGTAVTWWQLTPSEIDGIRFPTTAVGVGRVAPLTLTNRGATPRTPRIEIDGTRLTSTDCEGTLAPGASCTITATFAPVLPGAHDVFGGVTIDGVGIPYPLRGTAVERLQSAAMFAVPARVQEGDPVSVFFAEAADPYGETGGLRFGFAAHVVGGPDAVQPLGSSAAWTIPTMVVDDDARVDVLGTVENSAGVITEFRSTIVVVNVPPTVVVTAPGSVTVGRSITLNLDALDPSAADRGAGFDYVVDWGDGDSVAVVSTARATHVYAQPGTYPVTVRAIDKDGGTSAPVRHTVVVTAAVQDDSYGPGEVGGSGKPSEPDANRLPATGPDAGRHGLVAALLIGLAGACLAIRPLLRQRRSVARATARQE